MINTIKEITYFCCYVAQKYILNMDAHSVDSFYNTLWGCERNYQD
jgi:hypothetical protein